MARSCREDSVSSLPDELILEIFKYLDVPSELNQAALVNSYWYQLATDPSLWKRKNITRLRVRDFPSFSLASPLSYLRAIKLVTTEPEKVAQHHFLFPFELSRHLRYFSLLLLLDATPFLALASWGLFFGIVGILVVSTLILSRAKTLKFLLYGFVLFSLFTTVYALDTLPVRLITPIFTLLWFSMFFRILWFTYLHNTKTWAVPRSGRRFISSLSPMTMVVEMLIASNRAVEVSYVPALLSALLIGALVLALLRDGTASLKEELIVFVIVICACSALEIFDVRSTHVGYTFQLVVVPISLHPFSSGIVVGGLLYFAMSCLATHVNWLGTWKISSDTKKVYVWWCFQLSLCCHLLIGVLCFTFVNLDAPR